MSQSPGNEKVTKNNDRLFSIYEAHLKKPTVRDYADTAIKLAAWLSDPKAYYTAARPKIIKLLITAQKTLRGAVGYTLDINVPFMPAHCLDHPLAASYVRLVQAIAPFHSLFVEAHLKDTVTHLLRSVEGISLPSMSISSPFSSTSQQSPPSPSPPLAPSPLSYTRREKIITKETGPRPSIGFQSMEVHTSYQKPQVSGTPATESRQSAAEDNSASTPDPTRPVTLRSQRSPSPEIVFVGMYKKMETDSNSATFTPSTQGNSDLIGPLKQSRKVKPRKTKRIDLSAFVQSDLQDFKQKQAQALHQESDSVLSIKKEPGVEEISLTFNAGQQGDTTGVVPTLRDFESLPVVQIPEKFVTPARDSSLHEHGLPTPQPPVQPGRTEQLTDSKQAELIPTALSSHLAASRCPDLSDASNQRQKSSSTFISSLPSSAQPSSFRTSPALRPDPEVKDLAQAGLAGLQLPSSRPQHDAQFRTDVQLTPLLPLTSTTTGGPLCLSPTPAPSTVPAVGVPGTDTTAFEPSCTVGDGTQPATSVGDQSLPRADMIRPLLISEDSKLARFFKLYEEYKCVHASNEDNSSNNIEMRTEREQGERHDGASLAGDMAVLDLAAHTSETVFQVVAFTQGRIQDTCTEFTFTTTQLDMDPLSKWLKRSTLRLKDLMSSYCLSLGCYSSQELMEHLGNRLDVATEALLTKAITSLSSVWPQKGGLTMNINISGSRKDLPLAPPFVITGDGYVDVSEFVVFGGNSIIIHQQEKDFLDYTFVLHAHNPTLRQLQEIVGQREKEAEWKDWLVDVTRPLEFNMPAVFPAPP